MAANVDDAVQMQVDTSGIRIRDSIFMFFARFVDPAAEEASPVAESESEYYRAQLHKVATDQDWSTVVVQWAHFAAYDETTSLAVESMYVRCVSYVDEALHQILSQYFTNEYANRGRGRSGPTVAFSSVPRCFTVRTLRSTMVGQLCSISGTITRTSQVRPELLVGVFRCDNCGTESDPIEQQFRYNEPPACRNEQCENTHHWTLLPDHRMTKFGDWQKLRVQENANQIPVGCMPRTMEVICRGDVVESAKPGDRAVITGYAIVVPEVSKLFNQINRREVQRSMTGVQRGMMEDAQLQNLEGVTGLKALGVRDLNYKMCFLATTMADSHGDDRKMTHAMKETHEGAADDEQLYLTPAERDKIIAMRRSGNIFVSMAQCVAPTIFKHDLVKSGILLQMIGGVSKTTIEGIQLRGDINMCIIGDPSTAKSQFLKWVAANVNRGIYTSGKASTASGLTATITRDADTGERTIEAGALMLSDHGICCIDEFDKMDIKDQVAIHEAMEQQTISIAKAGIKATLNARTSLLAALNPIGGKYDRRKPLQKNITMTAPIMSRFDLMFCVVDDSTEQADEQMANRIVSLHRGGDSAIQSPFSSEDFQLYLNFARTVKPRLSDEAADIIVRAYKDLRIQDSLSNRSKVYRVTTRMLESIIRLSEATAKLFLRDVVGADHVNIALEIMKASLNTIDMTEVELVEPQEAAAVDATQQDPEADAAAAAAAAAEHKMKTKKKRTEQPQEAPKRETKKFTITAEHYNRIVNQITAKLYSTRDNDDNAPTRTEILKWYLGRQTTTDVEQLKHEMHVVELVINKLMEEGKVLELAMEGSTVQRLFLEPNYNPMQ